MIQSVLFTLANNMKLPIIQIAILGFYGYEKEEKEANLLSLAGIQSPLIKSLSGLSPSLCRQLLLDRRAQPSVLHFDVFIIVIAG